MKAENEESHRRVYDGEFVPSTVSHKFVILS